MGTHASTGKKQAHANPKPSIQGAFHAYSNVHKYIYDHSYQGVLHLSKG